MYNNYCKTILLITKKLQILTNDNILLINRINFSQFRGEPRQKLP